MRFSVDLSNPSAPRQEIPEDAPPLPPETDPVIIIALIEMERDRRIAAGFEFNGKLFQYRAPPKEDRENITRAVTAATAAMQSGAQAGDFRWLDMSQDFTFTTADNTEMPMDAPMTIMLGEAAYKHNLDHIKAAIHLKKIVPPPANYATHAAWPPAPLVT